MTVREIIFTVNLALFFASVILIFVFARKTDLARRSEDSDAIRKNKRRMAICAAAAGITGILDVFFVMAPQQ